MNYRDCYIYIVKRIKINRLYGLVIRKKKDDISNVIMLNKTEGTKRQNEVVGLHQETFEEAGSG